MPAPSGPRHGPVVPALILVQVLFGIHYLAAKRVMAEIPPLAWATLRVTAAALLLLPFSVWVARRGGRPRTGDLARLAGLSLLGVVINQVCFVEGLARTTLSHSSLINCSIPVLTLLVALLLRQESAGPLKVASIVLSLAGVLALLRVDHLVWDSVTTGDLLTLVNATSFSTFLVLSRPVLARLDALLATGALFVFGALGLLPFGAAAVGRVDYRTVSAAAWGWALFIVLGATMLAYFLNYYALRRVESSTVALFIYLQPILATTLDAAFLGSPVTARLGLAAGLIFGGVYLSIRAGRRRAVTPLPRGA
jgi:drug/metabolite transporter (DMT)-like permease